MTDREFQERMNELGHAWQGEVVPTDDVDAREGRQERMVGVIGDAIVRAAEGRRRERSHRRLFGLLAAAVVAAIAFVPIRRALETKAPSVTMASATEVAPLGGVNALSGQVLLRRGTKESVVRQAALALGDSLSVAEDGKAEVRLGTIVRADTVGESRLSVLADPIALHRLRLEQGRIEARVDDRPSPTPKLIVETPDVEVVVTGTVFDVDVAQGQTRVSVQKGRVVIRKNGAEVAVVSSGESWPVEEPVMAPPESPKPVRPAPKHQRAAVSGHVAPQPSSADLDDVRIGTLGEENALFQSAADARKRGDDAAVVDRMGQLLGRHPASLLSGEARVERMRALARMGRTDAAAREARRYLAQFPEGFARDEARQLVLRDSTRMGSTQQTP
jgi:lipoprotein-anchoring transpeptidase ErfK/SrfK